MGFRGVREASGFSRAKPVPQPSRHAQNQWKSAIGGACRTFPGSDAAQTLIAGPYGKLRAQTDGNGRVGAASRTDHARVAGLRADEIVLPGRYPDQ